MTNYKLIHDIRELQQFVDFLPELKKNECYFMILLARKKWNPESGIPSTVRLKRESIMDKAHLIRMIQQMECKIGSYTTLDNKPIPQENLGLYIGINPRDQNKAAFEFVDACLSRIKNDENINLRSIANDVVQITVGTKHFIDIDVDIKENETREELMEFITQTLGEAIITFVITSGGFHCLIDRTKITNKNWHQQLQSPKSALNGLKKYKSDINIMKGDALMPIPGCNQGKFVPFIKKIENEK